MWKFPPVRCLTQSKGSPATRPDSPQSDEETVFVRGFWINSRNGQMKLKPSVLPLGPGKGKGKDGGSNDENSRSGGGSQDPRVGDPSSKPSSSTYSSDPNGGHSRGSGLPSDALGSPIDESDVTSAQINHPCGVINKFALELISQIKPALLDTGCVAFSHDNDWISIIPESNEEIPPEAEFIRRICSKFKFVVEEDAIYPVFMTELDKELLELDPEASSSEHWILGTAFPVLLEFREAGDHSTADSAPSSSVSKSSPAPTVPPTSTPSSSLSPADSTAGSSLPIPVTPEITEPWYVADISKTALIEFLTLPKTEHRPAGVSERPANCEEAQQSAA
ncbi:Protein kinase of the Mitotic Exit Network [Marasmius sp. AFHP31]|nr:Protein kinase of the Mitotic Exit Network [Marasmius sp. AFHP31]